MCVSRRRGQGLLSTDFKYLKLSEIVECPIIIIVNVPEVALRIMANEKEVNFQNK